MFRMLMPGLINPELTTPGQRQIHKQTPSVILDFITSDFSLGHLCDKCLDVIAHEIELVNFVFV